MPVALQDKPTKVSGIANPFLTNDDYGLQFDDWTMLADFYEGARQVKSKRATYLPMTELEQKEESKGIASAGQKSAYQYRLERAVFVNGVARLTRFAISNLFRVNPIIPKWFLDENQDVTGNFDLLGTDLVQAMRNVSIQAYYMGHTFVVVDMPEQLPESAAAAKEKNFRPYGVLTDPRNVVDWSIVQDVNGTPRLEWVVIRSIEFEARVPFRNPDPYECYKVWYADRWEKWKLVVPVANSKDETRVVQIATGANPLGEVPVVPVYSNQLRPMVSTPPLLESAHLNHVHYMTYSSFNNGLLYHLSPILALIGVNEGDLKLGANRAIQLPQNADAKYVEYTGGNLSIAKASCEQLAQEIMEAGLRSTAMLGANTSAEARKLTRADFNAWLLSVASSYEFAWTDVLRLIEKWKGKPERPREDYKPLFNRDYDVVLIDAATATFYLNAFEKNAISHQTFLRSMQRGELLDDDLDLAQEMKDTEKEAKKAIAVKQQQMEAEAKLKQASQPPAPPPAAKQTPPPGGQAA